MANKIQRGPGRPKVQGPSQPRDGSKTDVILKLIRSGNPPADMYDLRLRAKRFKIFNGMEPSLSLCYKVRRFLTRTEVTKYFSGD